MANRLTNLTKSGSSLDLGAGESQDPEAEGQNLRMEVARLNLGLAEHSNLCEQLISKVKELSDKETDLRAKIIAHYNENRMDTAAVLAFTLTGVEAELDRKHLEAATAEQSYQSLLLSRDATVKDAQSKLAALRAELGSPKVEEAEAWLKGIATGKDGSADRPGGTFGRLHAMVAEGSTRASGRALVAKDSIDVTNGTQAPGETKALQDQALANFAARNGLAPGEHPALA